MATNGVKVTYIETQFVTSDAASFKSLVQRLTGKSTEATEPARHLHRPRPRRAGAADGMSTVSGAQGYYISASAGSASRATDDVRTEANAANAGASQSQPCLDEMHGLCDYPELLYVGGGSERHRGGSYSDLLY